VRGCDVLVSSCGLFVYFTWGLGRRYALRSANLPPQERSKLESEIAAQETEAAAATSRLQLEIRQVRAESKAVAIAKEHRKKFFAEKMVQLEAAEREEAEAAKGEQPPSAYQCLTQNQSRRSHCHVNVGIEGRMPCLDMIREELESCRKNYAQLEEQVSICLFLLSTFFHRSSAFYATLKR